MFQEVFILFRLSETKASEIISEFCATLDQLSETPIYSPSFRTLTSMLHNHTMDTLSLFYELLPFEQPVSESYRLM